MTDPSQTILEPSFGGCGFLNATARRLLDLGHQDPWKQIFGCDVDRRALKFLPEKFQRQDCPIQFRLGDFLTLEPKDFSHRSFDVILGNPPYVSRHTMTAKQIKSAEASIRGTKLSFRASLWAYFVLHSLKFLRDGGRIAWVLPRSLTQSIYGRELLSLLVIRFKFIRIISLGQRMFTSDGTEEITDVLLATNFDRAHDQRGGVDHIYADSLADLQNILTSQPKLAVVSEAYNPSSPTRSASLSQIQRNALNFVFQQPQCKQLGDLIDIKIGVVTGAADFFLLRRNALSEHGLHMKDCSVVISKYRQTRGLELNEADVKELSDSDERVHLIKCSQLNLSNRVQRYLETFPEKVRQKVATFKKREPWHYLNDGQIPAAFAPCLTRGGPRIVINSAGLICTNNVLRLWFRNKEDELFPKILSLSLVSTPGQITAEVFGRACGSGGLKLEPSDWLRFKLLLPTPPQKVVSEAFSEVDRLLRLGNGCAARKRADEFLLESLPAMASRLDIFETLKSALKALQTERS